MPTDSDVKLARMKQESLQEEMLLRLVLVR